MNIKKSLRITFRNKTYSLLNILGLAVGITATALIFLWAEDYVSFNRAIPNAKNLYLQGEHQYYGEDIHTVFAGSGPVARALKNDFPEIKRSSRFSWPSNQSFVSEGSTDIYSERGSFVDPDMLDMLSLTFVRGNKETAFAAAFPIILSEQMAEKIFGKEDPLGKILKMNDRSYEVTGVFRNLPKNTSVQYRWMSAFRILEQDELDQGNTSAVDHWMQNWFQIYVELEPTANLEHVNQQLGRLIPERVEGNRTTLFIYPILKLRLYNVFRNGVETGEGHIQTVRLFSWIGIIILLIACVNFVNLSTARSQKRALEVGLRKTFGTKRKVLIRQFLFESGVITFIALLTAVGLIYLLLPIVNQLTHKSLTLDWTNPWIVLGLFGIGLFCTVVAGSYPAFYLSSFAPINTLKKEKIGKGSAAWVRKGLVVFQFTVAFVLICSTCAVYLQIRHTQQRDLGINRDRLVFFSATDGIRNNFSAVENELLKTGMIEHVGLSGQTMLRIYNNGGGYSWEGKDPGVNPLISHFTVSPGLIETAGLEVTAGRSFLPEDIRSRKVIINQTLADMLGGEGRVGGRISRGAEYEIVGIVKNFLYNNMYQEKPGPLIIHPETNHTEYLFVRLKPTIPPKEATDKLVASLETFDSNASFHPVFMEDHFNEMFHGEQQQGSLSGLFAVLAIFISCLGLFGLSAFSAEQRTREIGIRKVLGASNGNILVLLGKSYMALILTALVIGTPIAWFIVSNYLNDYAYRLSLGWELFAGVALLVILIALLTVSVQSLRAALADPVKSIKTE